MGTVAIPNHEPTPVYELPFNFSARHGVNTPWLAMRCSATVSYMQQILLRVVTFVLIAQPSFANLPPIKPKSVVINMSLTGPGD
jgi:hypothetical protein